MEIDEKRKAKTEAAEVALANTKVLFKKYPKLPVELRLKVIKNVTTSASSREHARVVKILYFDPCSETIGPDGWEYHKSDHKHEVYSKIPALPQVDTEFREEALKKWNVDIERPDGTSYIRFDPEDTVVYLSYSCINEWRQNETLDMYSDMVTPEICSKIKHLAVDFDMWDYHDTIYPFQKSPLLRVSLSSSMTLDVLLTGTPKTKLGTSRSSLLIKRT